MKEVNLGPVYNSDGSPSDLTLEMLGVSREELCDRFCGCKGNYRPQNCQTLVNCTRCRIDHGKNIYLSPSAMPLVRDVVEDFLKVVENVTFDEENAESNDSWQWAIRDLRLFYEQMKKQM